MHQGESPAARSARGSAMPWILIAVTAIVLGLLGAHAFTGIEPTGRSTATAALAARTASAHAAHSLEAEAAASAQSAQAPASTGNGSGQIAAHAGHPVHTGETLSETGHLDLAAICMLALLFTVAALVRALPVRSSRASERIPLVLRPAVGGLADPPRPSLLRLGISRT